MKIGILFDLDGTLLDTLADLLSATNYALRAHGFPERTLPELRRFVGNGAYNQIRLSVGEGNEEHIQKVLDTYKPYYTEHCRILTRPYEGIEKALSVLKEKYPLAIVSNKPDGAVKALCADFFPGIYALGESAECPRKPAPDMVYRAMADIGVETCIYIGDSEVDVTTAHGANLPCLSVTWGFRDEDQIRAAGGTHFCHETKDLAPMLRQMLQQAQR